MRVCPYLGVNEYTHLYGINYIENYLTDSNTTAPGFDNDERLPSPMYT